ncbi:MAG: hypothetical protein EP330_20775 [Deltaproteobacteria bacterium]|nr:MAG: hypothetical protein EP330_20775 [Deltaproteobacteria bacterium]
MAWSRICAAVLAGSLLAAPSVARERDLPEFGWDWGTGRRYFLESSVGGVVMMFSADKNRDVVIRQFTTQMVVNCHDPERTGRRSYEVRCDIEDFAIQAMPRPSEAGLLQIVLEEVEAKLEDGAWLQVRMRDDGQLINFQLEDYQARFRDQNRMAENVRLILMRSFAGLDLRLPTRALDREQGVWGQTESTITMYPSALGTAGSVEMANLATKRSDDWVVIETAARATISPQAGKDTYATRVEARAVFDMAQGYMVERIWVAEGWATAGSASAEAGVRPYAQAGRLFVIEPTSASPVLMDTIELAPKPTQFSDKEATGGLAPAGN